MPKRIDPLTPSAVTNAKPKAKPYKLPERKSSPALMRTLMVPTTRTVLKAA